MDPTTTFLDAYWARLEQIVQEAVTHLKQKMPSAVPVMECVMGQDPAIVNAVAAFGDAVAVAAAAAIKLTAVAEEAAVAIAAYRAAAKNNNDGSIVDAVNEQSRLADENAKARSMN
jgi:hypothetical protein